MKYLPSGVNQHSWRCWAAARASDCPRDPRSGSVQQESILNRRLPVPDQGIPSFPAAVQDRFLSVVRRSTMIRMLALLTSLLMLLLCARFAHAWLRPTFEDATVVERSELIVVG